MFNPQGGGIQWDFFIFFIFANENINAIYTVGRAASVGRRTLKEATKGPICVAMHSLM